MNTNPEPNQTSARSIVKAVAAIIGLCLSLIAIHSCMKKVAENVVTDPAFIRKVAAEVRPYLIFDSNNTILADAGAGEYIGEIIVNCKTNITAGSKMGVEADGLAPITIVIRPKMHLANAPILEPLDGNTFSQAVSRGKNHDWKYILGFYNYTIMSEPARFRIEIVK